MSQRAGTRRLTEKGQNLYEKNLEKHLKEVSKVDKELKDLILRSQNETQIQTLSEVFNAIDHWHDRYLSVSTTLFKFLNRTGTAEAHNKLNTLTPVINRRSESVQNVLFDITEQIKCIRSKQNQSNSLLNVTQEQSDMISEKSVYLSRTCSEKSNTSSVLQRQKSKAEAAKARLAEAEREVQLAEAELVGMQKILQAEDIDRYNEQDDERLSSSHLHASRQRTADFVSDQQARNNMSQSLGNSNFSKQASYLNPNANEYTPQTYLCNPNEHMNFDQTDNPQIPPPQYIPQSQWGLCSELSKFLMKRDLLVSRLTKFTDKPEFYTVWKSSFTRIMDELGVSPLEEMDLFIKWFGPESSKQAMSVRAANAHDPERGLQRIWQRLHDRYASPELIESSIKAKLVSFPKLTPRDNMKLYDLSDIVSEIESLKENKTYASLLAYYDASAGVTPIVSKLTHNLQEKWINEAANYKEHYDVPYPPFSVFASFLRRQARIRNDPSFFYAPIDNTKKPTQAKHEHRIFTTKTDISEIWLCPFHDKAEGHTLNYCRAFRRLPIRERRDFLEKNGICFRCCNTTDHRVRDCKRDIQCFFCKSDKHATALHIEKSETKPSDRSDGGERKRQESSFNMKGGESNPHRAASNCTQICDNLIGGKSCAKTVLVKVFPKDNPDQFIWTYAVLDDQSNRSLATSEFFDNFHEKESPVEYTLASCAGYVTLSGRRTTGYVVQSSDGSSSLELPGIIECNQIPDMREDIPTPEAALHHSHLSDLAPLIPPIKPDVKISLLIGRDLPAAHHVLEQRIGLPTSPFAQRLNLGWVIVGEVCLGKVHKTDYVTVNKVHLLEDGRPTIMKPCPNRLELKDSFCEIGQNVFQRTAEDEQTALSVEDNEFLEIMNTEFQKNSDGNWTAPLPFRADRPRLPCNRPQAVHRAKLLDASLRKDPVKREHMITFMKKVIDNGHAEIAPPLESHQECWYLPLFGVYHPRKPGQIRGVFDSSAQFKGVSLNSVLLTGPDLTNNLLGILLRFRTAPIALTADIEQMFYGFKVKEEHRDYLRFIWYRNSNPENELIEYRMTAHVFGNSPSPAVATYGLRKSVENAEEDVNNFVTNDFYVDDALVSRETEETVIDLVLRTQKALREGGNLRLHKVASNSVKVLSAFPQDDLAKDTKNLDLQTENPPLQRSLGMCWDLTRDAFTFPVTLENKPFTRRGVLSTINSLYDPIGFMAPVVIRGKIFLRNVMSTTTEWDETLPDVYHSEWRTWCDSLKTLEQVYIPRHIGLVNSTTTELHIFSDASRFAIGAAAYVKLYEVKGESVVNFIFGKAKVSPPHCQTIPRLELCAAVLSVEIADTLIQQLSLQRDCVKFYTDSKVVLGYICNEKRRFHVYVANRTSRIRRSSLPEQWNYVETDCNPADIATRSIGAQLIEDSIWWKGPNFLYTNANVTCDDYALVDPDNDKEVRSSVTSVKTTVHDVQSLPPIIERFKKFSSWKKLVRAISLLQHITQSLRLKLNSTCRGWHLCDKFKQASSYTEAQNFILQTVQGEYFPEEIDCLVNGKPLPQNSPIQALSPTLDQDGILRVGGRLKQSDLTAQEIHPIIIPRKSHISTLLVHHFHQKTEHQGRHMTEGAVRSGGFWIIGAKRLVSSIIDQCVKCRKLRRQPEFQKMSDLPSDRLTPCPPFTYVGLDMFGPWEITTRRTRGGSASSKRWAILFTCLVTRAVHIDLVEDMSSSSFINCLRRFIALRGEVKQFRSDRGTNFVGATDLLCINSINVEDRQVQNFLCESGVTWLFNPPYSSHMGGVWERMIGVARRIIDSMFLSNQKPLTHEVLSTFMCEVTAIINARPITAVSSDAEQPLVLSPSTLLTQKTYQVPSFSASEAVDLRDMYKSQWQHVQALAAQFWKHWRCEYLHNLQVRPKWRHSRPNLKEGNLVLLKDKNCARNDWPVGVIETVYKSQDNLVRKASVRVYKDNKCVVYTRPIANLILLM